MSSATTTTTGTKRRKVHFDLTKPNDEKAPVASPLAQARSVCTLALTSLQPPIKSLAAAYSKQFLTLSQELHNLESQQTRLTTDTTLIPRSARLNFELSSTTRVKEKAPDRYTTLLEKVTTAKTNLQETFRKIILESIELEIDVLKQAIGDVFCVAVGSLCNAYVLDSPDITADAYAIVLAHALLEQYPTLVKYAHIEHGAALYLRFKETTLSPYPVHTDNSIIAGDLAVVTPLLTTTVHPLIERLFVTSLDQFNSAHNALKRASRVEEFVQFSLKESATEDTAMALDGSDLLTRETVGDLINDAVSKATSSLKKEVAKLKQQKNQGGGANHLTSSAPSQKNKKDKNAKDANAQAAGKSNASQKGKRNSAQKKKQKKQQKKKKKNNASQE